MCVGVGSGEARKPETVEIQGRVQGWVRGSVRFCEFAASDREADSVQLAMLLSKHNVLWFSLVCSALCWMWSRMFRLFS